MCSRPGEADMAAKAAAEVDAGSSARRFHDLRALASGSLLGPRLSLRLRAGVLWGVAGLAVLAVALLPPISDEPAYQTFVDSRALAGIPNFADVVSNLAFVVPGVVGLAYLLPSGRRPATFQEPAERWPYLVFFAGVLISGFGSAYFHLGPDTVRLAVDRTPITVAFMGFVAAMVSDRLSPRLGRAVLWPLVALGLGSVAFWFLGELDGAGDLRPYVLVQYLPMLLVPLLCVLFESRYPDGAAVWGTLLLYGGAKVAEVSDAAIFAMGHVVSGHTLKHLLGGLAAYWLLRVLQRRRLGKAEAVP